MDVETKAGVLKLAGCNIVDVDGGKYPGSLRWRVMYPPLRMALSQQEYYGAAIDVAYQNYLEHVVRRLS